MKEHPIIFGGEMVRAIPAGRKTQTRRVISWSNSYFDGGAWPTWAKAALKYEYQAWIDPGPSPAGNPGPYLKVELQGGDGAIHRIYPRYQPGDRLWVKESFLIDYESGESSHGQRSPDVYYRATDILTPWVKPSWKSGRFMPKWASRITLEVVRVRVERVQDICPDDVLAEGCPSMSTDEDFSEPTEWFADLWDSINEKRGFGWDVDPWVWVIEFKRLSTDAITESRMGTDGGEHG
jgi:hypothetical protein